MRAQSGIFSSADSPSPLTDGPLSFPTPVISNDGKKIYAIGTQRRGELVRYDSSCQEFRAYLGGISADHVEFSKDKRWIAYSSYLDHVLWRSRYDGSNRLQLSPPDMTAWFPRWSPDGMRIAFVGSRPGRPLKIYLLSAEGGHPELLVPWGSAELDPNWSPDSDEEIWGRAQAGDRASLYQR